MNIFEADPAAEAPQCKCHGTETLLVAALQEVELPPCPAHGASGTGPSSPLGGMALNPSTGAIAGALGMTNGDLPPAA